jgi:two-component system, LuxR family, sensor kinase FixL
VALGERPGHIYSRNTNPSVALFEEKVRALNAELVHAARLSVMGEMAAGVAHELHQPLYAISHYAGTSENLLKSGTEADIANVSTCVQKIGEQARRAGEIIRRLRNFVSHTTPQVESVGVASLISESLALLAPLLKEQGIKAKNLGGYEDLKKSLPHK